VKKSWKVIIQNIKEDRIYELNINGVFIYIGLTPNSNLFKDKINLDESEFIITDSEMRTNEKFVYAVGDVRKKN